MTSMVFPSKSTLPRRLLPHVLMITSAHTSLNIHPAKNCSGINKKGTLTFEGAFVLDSNKAGHELLAVMAQPWTYRNLLRDRVSSFSVIAQVETHLLRILGAT